MTGDSAKGRSYNEAQAKRRTYQTHPPRSLSWTGDICNVRLCYRDVSCGKPRDHSCRKQDRVGLREREGQIAKHAYQNRAEQYRASPGPVRQPTENHRGNELHQREDPYQRPVSEST